MGTLLTFDLRAQRSGGDHTARPRCRGTPRICQSGKIHQGPLRFHRSYPSSRESHYLPHISFNLIHEFFHEFARAEGGSPRSLLQLVPFSISLMSWKKTCKAPDGTEIAVCVRLRRLVSPLQGTVSVFHTEHGLHDDKEKIMTFFKSKVLSKKCF